MAGSGRHTWSWHGSTAGVPSLVTICLPYLGVFGGPPGAEVCVREGEEGGG